MDSDAEDSPSEGKPRNRNPRKRPDPSSPSPSEKKSKQEEEVEATVQVVQDQQESAPPLVAYFPSEFDPNGNSKDEERDELSAAAMARVYRNRNKPKRLQIVASANESNVDFVGTTYSGEPRLGSNIAIMPLGFLTKKPRP